MSNRTQHVGLISAARREIFEAALKSPLWMMLGWNDIRQRYRRSVLGPFWITISMAVFISVLGLIYSKIFSIEIKTYLPFLTAGYVIWGFISQTINESSGAFQEGDRIIKQIRLPYGLYVFRVVWRNIIIFAHTIVIFVPVALVFNVRPGAMIILAVPGFILLCLNLIWISAALAVIATRYRDIVQVVATAVQIALFATPIMWPISTLGESTWIANINPLYHFIDLVRGPLIGQLPALHSWAISTAIACIGSLIAVVLLRRASQRLVFWL